MKKIAKDVQHYLPLLTILLAGILGFVAFSYDKAFQIVIIIAVAAGYVVWGAVHHYLHRDLDFSVILEYLVLAALGVVTVLFLIFRA